jgi:iron complex transport system ATP-binding protein
VERLVALGLTPTLPAFGELPEAQRMRVDDMLHTCDLLPQRDQAATTLSGGELARAMLARALVGDPDVLILDEPMEGLDPRHTLDTAARLSTLAQAGKLVIVSMHDLTLAARHATRIVALDRGRVAAAGPPEQTLTPELIRAVFAVEARISSAGGGAFVDFLAPASGGMEQHR